MEAIGLEGDMTIGEAIEALERKGYYTARPRPWKLGFRDRGNGRGDFAVLDKFGDVVVEVPNQSDGELIISTVNSNSQDAIQFLEDEAKQLEKWADDTRTPMGLLTILGNEMMARAIIIRTKAESLRTG
jgi:hypothetical protein